MRRRSSGVGRRRTCCGSGAIAVSGKSSSGKPRSRARSAVCVDSPASRKSRSAVSSDGPKNWSRFNGAVVFFALATEHPLDLFSKRLKLDGRAGAPAVAEYTRLRCKTLAQRRVTPDLGLKHLRTKSFAQIVVDLTVSRRPSLIVIDQNTWRWKLWRVALTHSLGRIVELAQPLHAKRLGQYWRDNQIRRDQGIEHDCPFGWRAVNDDVVHGNREVVSGWASRHPRMPQRSDHVLQDEQTIHLRAQLLRCLRKERVCRADRYA